MKVKRAYRSQADISYGYFSRLWYCGISTGFVEYEKLGGNQFYHPEKTFISGVSFCIRLEIRELRGKKKTDKLSFLTICPLWLPETAKC